jgi:hypothetical protein
MSPDHLAVHSLRELAILLLRRLRRRGGVDACTEQSRVAPARPEGGAIRRRPRLSGLEGAGGRGRCILPPRRAGGDQLDGDRLRDGVGFVPDEMDGPAADVDE